MQTEKFDAYGAVLPDAPRSRREAAAAVPATLSRIGLAVFWLAVIVILGARIAYYPASPSFEAVSTATPASAGPAVVVAR